MERTAYAQLLICIMLLMLFDSASSSAQQAARLLSVGETHQVDSQETLQQQIHQLQQLVEEMNADRIRDRAQANAAILDLRQQLQDTQQRVHSLEESVKTLRAASVTNAAGTGEEAQDVQKLKEDQELTAAKVAEQFQTKVESGSKYHMRLSGMLLANLFSNKGNVEHIETPTVALPQSALDPTGSFGGSIRQSELGLQTYGPTVYGARVTGDVVLDFFGDFSATANGFSTGALL